ncbi:related to Aromatic amino acid aminotransferase 2 [Saccharomycodes ludwigii]|uniref:Related to Aromatic amino acid aminotransferase 2 n=1 Tax=Saccharomycodes ludwigii TaxID=36035 RepID=A0A376B1S9_9ASCO|nr:hypothetical protein SCDLUD_002962 [Saccharomycodes ludwigii]KAH3901467.1 hypothetical protein SCDLUD_002962 [Saccharomycodes ludwigii]SSD58592.1 related to Aromatic amino acid aminotransferase 2 [Saccharomycodes ludwigii]
MEELKQRYTKFLSKRDAWKKIEPFWINNNLPQNLVPHDSTIYLAGGMPNESLFPIESIHINVKNSPGVSNASNSTALDINEKIADGQLTNIWTYEQNKDKLGISQAFQYGESNGNPQLLKIARDIITSIHNTPQYEDWDVITTNGSADSLYKVCDLLFDEDSVMLMEEFTFPLTTTYLNNTGAEEIPLKVNITSDVEKQGIDTDYMADLLDNWSKYYPEKPKPKALYTIATGQNPTGVTQSVAKRRRIYDICSKHNMLIIEDDPYGYLKFTPFRPEDPDYNPYESGEIDLKVYCNKVLSPSYLRFDTDGRVIRCETFSKVFAPGIRSGFIVANKFFIKRLHNMAMCSTREPSGASQSILTNILLDMGENYQKTHPDSESYIDGWFEWCRKVASAYTHRRNVLFQALESTDAFKKHFFEISEPSAGMFVALNVTLKPEWKTVNDYTGAAEKDAYIKDVMDYLNWILLEEGCLAVLGYKMTVNQKFSLHRANFLRITFAQAANDCILREAALRLAKGIERLNLEYGTDKQKFCMNK